MTKLRLIKPNESDYRLLAECIRTGQIVQEHVPEILQRNQGFAAWYEKHRVKTKRRI